MNTFELSLNCVHTVVEAADVAEVFGEANTPFAAFDGTFEPVGIERPICYYMNEVDKLMVEFVNTHRVLTLNQLWQLLQERLDRTLSRVQVDEWAQRLVEAAFLDRGDFRRGDRIVRKVYGIGRRGRGYIGSMCPGVHIANHLSSMWEPLVDIPRLLSTNQFLLNTCVPQDSFSVCRKVYVPDSNRSDTVFRANAVIEQTNRTTFVDAVRRAPSAAERRAAEADLLGKLERINNVVTGGAQIDIVNPGCVLIAEDMGHMRELMQLCSRRRYRFELYFTADCLTYHTPENCLYAVEKRRNFLLALWTSIAS